MSSAESELGLRPIHRHRVIGAAGHRRTPPGGPDEVRERACGGPGGPGHPTASRVAKPVRKGRADRYAVGVLSACASGAVGHAAPERREVSPRRELWGAMPATGAMGAGPCANSGFLRGFPLAAD